MDDPVACILAENSRRLGEIARPFDPITGLNSVGKRKEVTIVGISDKPLYLPEPMLAVPLIAGLVKAGSVSAFLEKELRRKSTEMEQRALLTQYVRTRSLYDFPFWAAMFCWIKKKGSGEDVRFVLTRPQRRFVEELEKARLADKPIRIILLKARQWGGSTTSQLYMAWLQLVHRKGLNSLIIAHQTAGSDEIKDMFDRMIARYPAEMLHPLGEKFHPLEPKLRRVGQSGSIFRVPQRNCKIKIGTAQSPDSSRGGDYSLVHLSEVGLWAATDGKQPEDIVQAACSGVLYQPGTMIVYESTAKGTGNFFHREYTAATDPKAKSQFSPLFVSWFDIEQNSLPFASEQERKTFATDLYNGRNARQAPSDRQEPGYYLYWLWNKGATLEAINWYVHERAKFNDHGRMASESPSDDVEAFVHSGQMVFDKYLVEAFRQPCKTLPAAIGEVTAQAPSGEKALQGITFCRDHTGALSLWQLPEVPPKNSPERFKHRYLTVVDVGGRSDKADWSVIVVFDRIFMADGARPVVCAQWRGHCDTDLLAWKAAQIAAYYDNALLVIESNTLETRDRDRTVDGDQAPFILDQIKDVYPNLYARAQPPEDIRQGLPRRYGFHTNTATKPMIIAHLVKMVREHAWVERDERCLDELLQYERKPNGSFGAITGCHDDILMTRAIGLHICYNEMPIPVPVTPVDYSKMPGRPVSEASF